MATTKKAVGDKLNLRVNLSGAEPDRFVKAFLYNQSGTLIDTVELTNRDGEGIYGDDIKTMPSIDHLDVKYLVFLDSGYAVRDTLYPASVDSFERDGVNPAAYIPKPYMIEVKFEQAKDVVVAIEQPELTGQILPGGAVVGQIEQANLIAELKNENTIQGVLNDC